VATDVAARHGQQRDHDHQRPQSELEFHRRIISDRGPQEQGTHPPRQVLDSNRSAKCGSWRRYDCNSPAATFPTDEANLDADTIDVDDTRLALGIPVD
jgi:hypothetical protein